MKLLATNYKLEKSVPGYSLIGLSLAPHTVAGGPTVCPYSTAECRSVCLGTETGLNVLASAVRAKVERTQLWFNYPDRFKAQLMAEVSRAARKAAREGLKLGVRLNVYSDIRWELEFYDLFAEFPNVQFYDYTKIPGRHAILPRNYHLTYSYSGTQASNRAAAEYLRAGINVAVVFPDTLPRYHEPVPGCGRLPVVNGDLNDFRPGDPKPCVVGLKFKGPKAGLVQLKKFVAQEPARVAR